MNWFHCFHPFHVCNLTRLSMATMHYYALDVIKWTRKNNPLAELNLIQHSGSMHSEMGFLNIKLNCELQ